MCHPCAVSLSWRDAEYETVRKARRALARRFVAVQLGAGAGVGSGSGQYERGLGQWPDECVIQCWRATRCLAVREVEVEVEASGMELQQQQQQRQSFNEGGNERGNERGNGNGNAGYYQQRADPGYAWQEVEGVGGVMKGKRKVKVGVGGWVDLPPGGRGGLLAEAAAGGLGVQQKEEDDDDDRALWNWCGWCERVVLEAGAEAKVEVEAEAKAEATH